MDDRQGGAGASVASRVLGGVLAVGYPLVVYWGMTRWGPRGAGALVALFLVGVGLVRWRGGAWAAFRPFVPAAMLAVVSMFVGDGRLLLALPVLVNLMLLGSFASSMRAGAVPTVQRFALLELARRDPGGRLSEAAVAHCRRMNLVWCGFFVLNGFVAGVLAWRGALGWWALHTCLLSYLGMAAMFGLERLLRARLVRRGEVLVVTCAES